VTADVFLMGSTDFDRANNTPMATSEATDSISAKRLNANEDNFESEMALAA